MLRVENYSYRHLHSPARALKNVSFTVNPGETLLLTGQSGSGKSTLLSAVAGLIPHYYKGEACGRIVVGETEPKDVPLNKIGQQIGLMLQNAEVQFLAPTVEEEIFLSLKCRDLNMERCKELTAIQLKKFKLEHIRNSSVFELSEGQKQKVVLAAITALKPKVLLLDEPTANLDPLSIVELKEILLALKTEGVALLIADHRLAWLNGLCESIVVLSHGEVIWQGDFTALLTDKQYEILGLRMPLKQEERPIEVAGMAQESIRAQNLCFAYNPDTPIFNDFNGIIPYGKVTVLNGPSGIGKTTLAKVFAGLVTPQQGGIYFDETKVARRNLPTYTKVVLQNSDHQLYMNSVLSEVCLSISMCPRKSQDEARKILEGFGLGELIVRHPQSLSGGEKQRLVVAVAVAVPSRLMILDEPTSGLDGHNLRLMAAHIRALADKGIAVLVITHDVELINMCADYKLACNFGGEAPACGGLDSEAALRPAAQPCFDLHLHHT